MVSHKGTRSRDGDPVGPPCAARDGRMRGRRRATDGSGVMDLAFAETLAVTRACFMRSAYGPSSVSFEAFPAVRRRGRIVPRRL
ncbi:hypothetical protein GW17_00058658 [Ensete ventricosum]|nr:hypothetical protein GW17_00058658 [Ensete ventricosum]